MSVIRVGHTEGGYSFSGGDPNEQGNWKKIGTNEDGYKFTGGDPNTKDNWEPVIDKEEEASLGPMNRAQYALEPIQSNRKAFLEKEFGQENIMEDKKGELYLKQNGSFLPLNKGGVSVADGADFAGALPEIVGGFVGAGVGALAGVPTGGTASIPLAATMGASGAGAGSIARQALSAAIGTPQVASLGERALETGMSAGVGGVMSAAGTYLKPVVKSAGAGITNFLKNLKNSLTETVSDTVADSVADTTSKTIAKTGMNISGEINPLGGPETARSIMGEVADRSGDAVVQEEKKKLAEIAMKEGLPEASYAMTTQGKAIIAENRIMDMKFIGKNVRSMANKQAALIKNNLEKITGRTIDAESDNRTVGQTVKEYGETMLTATKKIATELYEQVEEDGANASVNTQQLYRYFLNGGRKLGLLDNNGNPIEHAAEHGLSREEFSLLQSAFMDGIKSLKRSKINFKNANSGFNPLSAKMPFKDANGVRRTMNKTAKEMAKANSSAARLLNGFTEGLDDTMEQALNKESSDLGRIFKAANSTYRKYKTDQKVVEKMIGNLDDEKVVARVMNSTGNIKALQEIVGEDKVKEIAKSHIADVLFKLNKSGIARADSAIDAVRKSAPHIQDALGKETYDSLMNNLYYLNRTGRPLTLSRPNLYNVMDSRGQGWKGAVISLKGTADTIAESKGTTIGKEISKTVTKPVGKIIETTGKVIDKSTGSQKAAGLANLLTDGQQRSFSNISKQQASTLSEREKEIEKRKRAISGSKNGKG